MYAGKHTKLVPNTLNIVGAKVVYFLADKKTNYLGHTRMNFAL